MYVSVSSDRFTTSPTGIGDRIISPRVYKAGRRPVIFMAGGYETAWDDPVAFQPALSAIAEQLNLTILMPTVSALAGNAQADAHITDALAWGRANLGMSNEPPILIGISNGCICALLYALDQPVAGIVGILPPVDSQYIYENNLLGLRGFFETAWSVTYPTPLPAGASAYQAVASLVGTPMHFEYASDDTISTNLTAFATAHGFSSLHNVGALGHSVGAVAAAASNSPAIVSFIQAHSGGN